MITPEQIKAYRKINNLTQAQLATLANVSAPKVRLIWEKKGIQDKAIAEANVIIKMQNTEL